jgi:MarR family transcriptional regulator, transcriptional regulator for hemolysin
MTPKIIAMPGHLINRASRLHIRRSEGRFHALGLAVAQMPVLGALKDGASLPQKELARFAQIEQPTMAQLLTRMERDGLIQRTPDPGDKRSSLISLTPLAKKKLPAVRRLLLECNAEALRGFTDREIKTLSRLLRRVVQNLDPEWTTIETLRR